MREKFIKLGWSLLEHKYRYYILNNPQISDHEFDQLESEYRNLAEQLELIPSASDMVDFNMTRPACIHAAIKVHGLQFDNESLYQLGSDGSIYITKDGKRRKVQYEAK